MKKELLEKSANLIGHISLYINDERASKMGYDMIMGLISDNAEDRLEAWENYVKQIETGNNNFCDTQRDGCWVPAIPIK